ncbi:MAG: hypothetical protein ACR2OV_18185 [Hyphomicrobiaceae bacterium]
MVEVISAKLAKIYDDVGGFGQLLGLGFDCLDDREAWRHSLELLAKDVLPRVQHLRSGAEVAAE